jgi:hypothetical protein
MVLDAKAQVIDNKTLKMINVLLAKDANKAQQPFLDNRPAQSGRRTVRSMKTELLGRMVLQTIIVCKCFWSTPGHATAKNLTVHHVNS